MALKPMPRFTPNQVPIANTLDRPIQNNRRIGAYQLSKLSPMHIDHFYAGLQWDGARDDGKRRFAE